MQVHSQTDKCDDEWTMVDGSDDATLEILQSENDYESLQVLVDDEENERDTSNATKGSMHPKERQEPSILHVIKEEADSRTAESSRAEQADPNLKFKHEQCSVGKMVDRNEKNEKPLSDGTASTEEMLLFYPPMITFDSSDATLVSDICDDQSVYTEYSLSGFTQYHDQLQKSPGTKRKGAKTTSQSNSHGNRDALSSSPKKTSDSPSAKKRWIKRALMNSVFRNSSKTNGDDTSTTKGGTKGNQERKITGGVISKSAPFVLQLSGDPSDESHAEQIQSPRSPKQSIKQKGASGRSPGTTGMPTKSGSYELEKSCKVIEGVGSVKQPRPSAKETSLAAPQHDTVENRGRPCGRNSDRQHRRFSESCRHSDCLSSEIHSEHRQRRHSESHRKHDQPSRETQSSRQQKRYVESHIPSDLRYTETSDRQQGRCSENRRYSDRRYTEKFDDHQRRKSENHRPETSGHQQRRYSENHRPSDRCNTETVKSPDRRLSEPKCVHHQRCYSESHEPSERHSVGLQHPCDHRLSEAESSHQQIRHSESHRTSDWHQLTQTESPYHQRRYSESQVPSMFVSGVKGVDLHQDRSSEYSRTRLERSRSLTAHGTPIGTHWKHETDSKVFVDGGTSSHQQLQSSEFAKVTSSKESNFSPALYLQRQAPEIDGVCQSPKDSDCQNPQNPNEIKHPRESNGTREGQATMSESHSNPDEVSPSESLERSKSPVTKGTTTVVHATIDKAVETVSESSIMLSRTLTGTSLPAPIKHLSSKGDSGGINAHTVGKIPTVEGHDSPRRVGASSGTSYDNRRRELGDKGQRRSSGSKGKPSPSQRSPRKMSVRKQAFSAGKLPLENSGGTIGGIDPREMEKFKVAINIRRDKKEMTRQRTDMRLKKDGNNRREMTEDAFDEYLSNIQQIRILKRRSKSKAEAAELARQRADLLVDLIMPAESLDVKEASRRAGYNYY